MKNGFTLTELLVYSALTALILTFAAIFAISIARETSKSSFREEIQRNAAGILRTFAFEVTHAQSIYTSTSDFIGNPGRLSLLSTLMPPSGESRAYLDMYVDNGAFCLKRELAGVSCITNASTTQITSLTFRRIAQAGGKESVQLRFTIRHPHPNAEFQFPLTLQTSARLRGY